MSLLKLPWLLTETTVRCSRVLNRVSVSRFTELLENLNLFPRVSLHWLLLLGLNIADRFPDRATRRRGNAQGHSLPAQENKPRALLSVNYSIKYVLTKQKGLCVTPIFLKK
jgi:hypothetical protein